MKIYGTYIVNGWQVNELTVVFNVESGTATLTYLHDGKEVEPFIVTKGERMAYDIDTPIGVLPFEERTKLPKSVPAEGTVDEHELKPSGPFHTAWIDDALVGYGPSPEVMLVRDIVEVRFYATEEDMKSDIE